MAVEVEIISRLENTETVKDLLKFEKEVKNTSQSLATLEARQEALNEAFRNADPKSEEYKQLQKDLVGVTRQIKNAELSIEALDTDQVASELGGLVGGFADVATGSVLAFGVSQESADEFLKTFAQVEGAGKVVKGSIEGVQAGLKLYNSVVANASILTKAQAAATAVLSSVQSAFSLVVGTTTGALKVFRIALASTGIGLLVVGLGLLIANFETVVDFVKESVLSFEGLKKALLFIIPPIGLIVLAYEKLFGSSEKQKKSEAELEKERKENFKEEIKRSKEVIKQAKKRRDAIVKSIKIENQALELQAKIRENNGESSDKERIKILENNAAKVRSEVETAQQIFQAREAQFRAQARLQGLSDEQFIKQQKARGVDLEFFQRQAAFVLERGNLKIEAAESEITKFKREQDEARASSAKEAADRQAKIEEDLAKRKLDAARKLEILRIESIEDAQEREIQLAQDKFRQEIKNLSDNIQEEALLRTTLEENLQQDIADIKQKFRDEENAAKKDQDEKELQALKDAFDAEQNIQTLRIDLLKAEAAAVTDLDEIKKFDIDIANAEFAQELDQLRFELDTKQITKEEADLREQIATEEHQQELNRIEEENRKQRIEASLAETQAKIDNAAFFLDSARSLNDAFNQIQENQLKEGEELTEKQQKRAFQREKAFNIAQALIGGAGAVVKAIAQFGPPPSPLGIAGIASAGIITAAQIAAISSQKFNPSSPSSGGGGAATAGFSASAASSQTPNIPQTTPVENPNNEGGDSQPEGGGGGIPKSPPLRAYVITGDITDAQDAQKVIDVQSSL